MAVKEEVSLPSQRVCIRCNFVSSQEVCKACVLLEGLNKGLPKLGIGKSSKAKKMLDEYNAKQKNNLEEAIKDINDEYKKNNCISKGKICRLSCKNEKSHSAHINEQDGKTSSETCCNGQCSEKQLMDNGETNKKVKILLKEYGLSETVQGNSTEKLLTDDDKKINDTNDDENIDTVNGDVQLADEDDTCGGTCGKIDSLHIGF